MSVLNGLQWQVATFILQKILLDETGLSYICQTYERFSHVAMILVSNIHTVCISCVRAIESLQRYIQSFNSFFYEKQQQQQL